MDEQELSVKVFKALGHPIRYIMDPSVYAN